MPLARVELRGVSKSYSNGGQPVEVLHDISLSAAPGTITALVGRSGCGKTTLLNLAGAMDFPTNGQVLIDGRDTSSLSESELTGLRRRRVGFVFQFFQLLPTLTVLENVELPLLLAHAPKAPETALDRLRWVCLLYTSPIASAIRSDSERESLIAFPNSCTKCFKGSSTE